MPDDLESAGLSATLGAHELVLLHGQPGSAADWVQVAERLPPTLARTPSRASSDRREPRGCRVMVCRYLHLRSGHRFLAKNSVSFPATCGTYSGL